MRNIFWGLLLIVITVQCQRSEMQTTADGSLPMVSIQPVKATYDAFGINTELFQVKEFIVQQNESLYLLLAKFNFDPGRIFKITKKAKQVFDIHAFKPGQRYRAYISEKDSSRLQKMVWQSSPVNFVVFDWQQDSLRIYKASRPVIKRTSLVSGTITSSLYEAISDEETRDELVYEMTEILAWQIDFFNLRDGDTFKIVYEKKYVGDQYYDIGEVKAVKFEHMGDTYFAYRFQRGEFDGYFDEQGKSVQKALLKTPFKYDYRISSGFNPRRFHPVLHTYRAHNGTDYAAPYGTPVLAVGDGVITRAGYVGAAGNMVKIKHNGTYETAYMHLSDFAEGVYVGAHVEQGEVVGYVGATGRVTGTHLHYSVYRNGDPVNSLTLDLPPARSLPDKYMDEFRKVQKQLNERLIEKGSMLVSELGK